MKKRMKRGSMTIEAALLMPLLLLVVTITLYLFFTYIIRSGSQPRLTKQLLTAVWKRHGQKGKAVIKH